MVMVMVVSVEGSVSGRECGREVLCLEGVWKGGREGSLMFGGREGGEGWESYVSRPTPIV